MIRSVVLASAAVLVLSGSAGAADLPLRTPAPLPYVPPVFTWSGFYIGAHVGALLQAGHLNLSSVTSESPPDRALDPNLGGTNVIGGVLLGYNYQIGSAVVGLEGDVGFSDAKSTMLSAKATVPMSVWYSANKLSEDINGHVRARLGWAFGPLLVYASGGLALTDSKLNVVGYCPPDTYYGKASHTLLGGSVGAGAEYALTNNILVRAEYIFDDYGHQTYAVPPAGQWQDRELNLQTHTFRAAVSYKF